MVLETILSVSVFKASFSVLLLNLLITPVHLYIGNSAVNTKQKLSGLFVPL